MGDMKTRICWKFILYWLFITIISSYFLHNGCVFILFFYYVSIFKPKLWSVLFLSDTIHQSVGRWHTWNLFSHLWLKTTSDLLFDNLSSRNAKIFLFKAWITYFCFFTIKYHFHKFPLNHKNSSAFIYCFQVFSVTPIHGRSGAIICIHSGLVYNILH